MRAAFIIIGNEILDGSTKEGNLQTLGRGLTGKGIALVETRVVRDEMDHIKLALEQTVPRYDYVFTSGGIGPTHDDITFMAVASFFDVQLELNDESLRRLTEHYKDRGLNYINEAVKKMAYAPVGAEPIDNAISAAPGFRINNVYVLAGVPEIFQSMLDSLLAKLPGGEIMHRKSLIVYSGENRIAECLAGLQNEDLEIGSYPGQADDGSYYTKVVLRSYKRQNIKDGIENLRRDLAKLNISAELYSSA